MTTSSVSERGGLLAPVPAASGVELDPRTFRDVMGRYPTGVALVAGRGESGEPLGMVVGTLTSVSLDPPLVAFLPSKSSSSWAKMQRVHQLCINVLAADQEEVCRTFASKSVEDKWADVTWHPAPSGAPIIDGSVAWIDCLVEEVLERGDHFVVFARVQAMESARSVSPLTFVRGGYGKFSIDSLVAEDQPGLMEQLKIAQQSRGTIEQLARETGYETSIQAAVDDELVILAAAGGDDSDWAGKHHVGIRLPFIPPLGGIFMAWSSTSAIQEWVGRRWANNDGWRDRQVDALRAIRDAGFVVVPPIAPEIDSVLDRVFLGEAPSLDDLSLLRQAAHELEPYYVTAIDGDRLVPVRYLGAPVFDNRGRVAVVVRLIVDEVLDARRVRALIDRLMAAADEISDLIGGQRLAQEDGTDGE